jgi:hypothetical protein
MKTLFNFIALFLITGCISLTGVNLKTDDLLVRDDATILDKTTINGSLDLGADGSDFTITVFDADGDLTITWANVLNRLELSQQLYLTDGLILPSLSNATFGGLVTINSTGRLVIDGPLNSDLDGPVTLSDTITVDTATGTTFGDGTDQDTVIAALDTLTNDGNVIAWDNVNTEIDTAFKWNFGGAVDVSGVLGLNVDFAATVGALVNEGGYVQQDLLEKTGTYNITTADHIIWTSGAGTFSVFLPAVATAATGQIYTVKHTGSGTVTLDANGAETIDGATTVALATDDSITVINNGTEWLRLD